MAALRSAYPAGAPVCLTVGSQIAVTSAALSDRSLRELRQRLSLDNPEYVKRLKFNRDAVPWGIPPKLCYVDESTPGIVRVPRGAGLILRDMLEKAGALVSRYDARQRLPEVAFRTVTGNRGYQDEAIDALMAGHQGHAVLPCGAGKTRIGMSLIAECRQPAVVLVHTADLAAQWKDAAKELLGVDAAMYGGGHRRTGDITIAMVQTLAKLTDAELTRFLLRFGTFVADECHHVPAVSFARIVNASPARYRFGLTATPEREDGLTDLLTWLLGKRVFAITQTQLIEAGHLMRPRVEVVWTAFEHVSEGDRFDWTACADALTANAARNQLIVELAEREARSGCTVLVLTGRVDHAEALAARLRSRGIKALAVHGESKQDDRRAAIKALRERRLEVLCATTIADEGLDVPALDRVILAFPSKSERQVIQRVGRAIRKSAGKGDPVIYDVVDPVGVLIKQHQLRREALVEAYGPDIFPNKPPRRQRPRVAGQQQGKQQQRPLAIPSGHRRAS